MFIHIEIATFQLHQLQVHGSRQSSTRHAFGQRGGPSIEVGLPRLQSIGLPDCRRLLVIKTLEPFDYHLLDVYSAG